MRQRIDESLESWKSRLYGHADLCEFRIKCNTCDAQVSYKDDRIKTKMITGLTSTEWKEKILAQGDILSLEKTFKFLD